MNDAERIEFVKMMFEKGKAEERDRIVAIIKTWRDSQTLTDGGMVDRMSRDFTQGAANEILDLVRASVSPQSQETTDE